VEVGGRDDANDDVDDVGRCLITEKELVLGGEKRVGRRKEGGKSSVRRSGVILALSRTTARSRRKKRLIRGVESE
jgi:hypothetical protein